MRNKNKKHLKTFYKKTYMLDGEYFYSPMVRKKVNLLSDLTIKHLWKPIISSDANLTNTPIERYLLRYSKKV